MNKSDILDGFAFMGVAALLELSKFGHLEDKT